MDTLRNLLITPSPYPCLSASWTTLPVIVAEAVLEDEDVGRLVAGWLAGLGWVGPSGLGGGCRRAYALHRSFVIDNDCECNIQDRR